MLLAVCWCPATRLTTGESPDQAFLQRHQHVPFKTWSPKTAFAYLCTCPTVARCARCLADDHDLRLGNGEWLATQNAATLRQYPDIPASARTLICVMVHQAMSTCVAFLTLGVAVRLTMVLLCVCVFVCLYLSQPLDLFLGLFLLWQTSANTAYTSLTPRQVVSGRSLVIPLAVVANNALISGVVCRHVRSGAQGSQLNQQVQCHPRRRSEGVLPPRYMPLTRQQVARLS